MMKIKLSNIKKKCQNKFGQRRNKDKQYKDKTKNKETVLISFIKKGKLEKK